MSEIDRAEEVVDLLCITAEHGTLALPAADVASIHDGEDSGGEVPSLDLAPLIGHGPGTTAPRRIRVAAAEAPPFDIVTGGAISVRTATRGALEPVPRWLAPFCATLGVEELLLAEDALVLLADARRLAARATPRPPQPERAS